MKFKNVSILSALLTFATACATTPPIENFAVDASPTDEIQRLEKDLNQAAAEQVEVLSPTNYREAREALNDAKDSLADKDDAKDILSDVAEGRAYLKRAQEVAKVSTDNMSDVVAARTLALKEGAKEHFAKEFRDADGDLMDVTKDIEENKTETAAKKRSEIQARYLGLELRAIRRNALAQAEGVIRDAERSGAKEYAPRTLVVAEKSLKDADAFIIANRHDTAQIKVLSDKALADANQLKKITGLAKSGEKTTEEELALRIDAANQAVVQKQAELATTQSQLNQTAAAAAGATAGLQAKESLDKKYEQARAMFTKDEAEVYRQGDALVIRLRGLEFAKAKAELKGENFPLLSKVQNVIAEFPASTVTVEGHTDSKGGKAINEKVSQARANAVKSYFESNAKPEGVKFSAIGYGFQKPLATNKTEGGRAQNRRVDIVIQPENM